MYLVSPEYVSHQPPPTPSPLQPMAEMTKPRTKNSKQGRRRETKQHPYDRWVKLKRKIEDADVTRKTLISKIAAFLQSVLPYSSTSAGHAAMPPPATPDVQAGLSAEASDTAPPHFRSCPVHMKLYSHRQ